MTFDVRVVRQSYPALSDGYAYLDGAAGTQVPTPVIDAIAEAYRTGIGNVGGAFPASARSEHLVAECRRAVADLLGAHPDGVILGPNMTTLTYRLAAALSGDWESARRVELVLPETGVCNRSAAPSETAAAASACCGSGSPNSSTVTAA